MTAEYRCKVCRASHDKKKNALACEKQKTAPKFELEENVLYNAGSPYATILHITAMHVTHYNHGCVYDTYAVQQEYKKIFFPGGLVRECDLTKIKE